MYDPASEDYYYYNNFTGECVWEEPEGYKPINYTLLMMMAKNAKSELWASLLVQKTWRAKKARGDVRSKRGEQSGQTSGWEAIEDPGSGEFYYYNHDTGETGWEKPEELMTESEKEAKACEAPMPTWAKVYDPASTEYYCPCDFLQSTFHFVWIRAVFFQLRMLILALCDK